MLSYELHSHGAEVSRIQTALRALGLYHGPVDGDFGGGTLAAVKAMEFGTGDAAAVAHGDDPDPRLRPTADLQRALSRTPSEARCGPGGATGVGALDPGASLATPARTLAGVFQDLGSATRVPGAPAQV